MSNAFLIRAPEAVLASYARKRPGPLGLDEIGLPAQLALFERAADRLGRAPPVIDGRDVQADPRGMLGALCAALGLAFDAAMLAWPPGRRDSDGVWAPAWYAEVEKSTGFAPPAAEPGFDDLPDSLKADRRGRAAALRASGAPQACGLMSGREARRTRKARKASG